MGQFAESCQISRRSVNPLLWYRDFCGFQDGDRRHLGFWKIQHFNGLSPVAGQFAKSVKRLVRYDDLTVFFEMAAVCHLVFWKFKLFNGLDGSETHFASSCQISWRWSNRCWDIAIFWFSNWRLPPGFSKIGNFYSRLAVGDQCVSSCLILLTSVKQLRRYCERFSKCLSVVHKREPCKSGWIDRDDYPNSHFHVVPEHRSKNRISSFWITATTKTTI